MGNELPPRAKGLHMMPRIETHFTSSLTPFLIPAGVHKNGSDVCECAKRNQRHSSSILAIWLPNLSGLQQRKLISSCQLMPV